MNETELIETKYFCSYLKRSFFKVNTFTSFDNKIDVLVGTLLMASKNILKLNKKQHVLYKDIYDYVEYIKTSSDYNFYLFKTLKEYDFNKLISFKYELQFKDGLPLIDYLGLAYQFILYEYQKGTMQFQCSYYTSINTFNNLIATYFDLKFGEYLFDPFCGSGRQLWSCKNTRGSDLDNTAVDIANLNNFIIKYNTSVSPYIVKDFYKNDLQEDYILTNIPFEKSLNKEAIIINKLEAMSNKQCVAIIPAGHYNKMIEKNLINNDWECIDSLDIDEFQQFTKIQTEVILITKKYNEKCQK